MTHPFTPVPKPPKKVKPRKPLGQTRKPSKMFAGRRVPGYSQWIGTFECLVASKHKCDGKIECHHVQTRRSGGDDIGNCVPLCKLAHEQWGLWGPVSWQKRYTVDARLVAVQLGRLYQRTVAPCP